MATRDVFSAEELTRLRGFPEITRAELIRYFTLTGPNVAFLRKFHSRVNVLGAGVQLCSLPWLGFVPDDVTAAPAAAVGRLAERLDIPAGDLVGYGQRGQTRTEHLREVLAYAGWRPVDRPGWKELDEFLFARAMEHDSPKLLFRLACEYLASQRIVRPGVILLLEHVASARERARDETWMLLAHLVNEDQGEGALRRRELDRLLVVDSELGRTPLRWLETGPTTSSPAAVHTELAKLAYLRRLDAHTLDLSMLPAERRRFLAGVGRRLTGQGLARRDPERRYPILLAMLAESAADVLDEVVLLFDQALSGRESAARTRLREMLAERARDGEDRQALLDEILAITLDVEIDEQQVGRLLREGIGMERMRAAWAARKERLPADHGHLALLDASMGYVRQFVPAVLAAVRFAGGPGTSDLLAAVATLGELYATGARKVPAGTPTGFVPTRWAGYLQTATQAGDVTAYRHYWELCVLLALRDGLRSGDIYVPGSRRYADPAAFLLTGQQWEARRAEYCHLVGKPADGRAALAAAADELHAALADLEAQLAAGGPAGVRLNDDGELIIPRLAAEDVPTEAAAVRDELSGMLPVVPIASLLVEVDARTAFTGHLIHAGGQVTRSPELKRNLFYVLLAEATNMGLAEMAAAAGISYEALAWTAEWYFRPETLEAANAVIVNHHHTLPFAQVAGTGTLSSSDGQRFPVAGKSITAAHLSRYFARGAGISAYTAVSDQHATYDTKVIPATVPEAPLVLDEVLGNATDLMIVEHATDTHGATLANFALFDLAGKQLSPRMRDLGKITLVRPGPRADYTDRYPHAGPLLSRRLQTDLIAGCWDDLLRVAASVHGGHATAAMVVGKLCSSKKQQNTLTAATKEYGALRRTIYAARYLADETYQRRIGRQLNKGENVHTLRRHIAHVHQGTLRRRYHEQQTEQMWCLTLVTNAVVCWMAEYLGLAVAALRAGGRHIDDEILGHVWPPPRERAPARHPHRRHRRRPGRAGRQRLPAVAPTARRIAERSHDRRRSRRRHRRKQPRPTTQVKQIHRITAHYPVGCSTTRISDRRQRNPADRTTPARYPVGRPGRKLTVAATVTKLEIPRGRQRPAKAGGPTVRAAIDGFLDSPNVKANPNTLRAYTSVLDRVGEEVDSRRKLAGVHDDEITGALAGLWGDAKPATWNRNRAAVGSWLAWCADRQHWTAPVLPAAAQRRRENNDDTKAVSRSRIDRLCRRRDVPLREKTLWRMLYESASRASAILALNVEDLDLPNKQARITAKGGDMMWITWGTNTAHLLPRLIAGRQRGPLFLSEHRPGPHRLATTDSRDICPETGRVRLGYDRARVLLARCADGTGLHQLRHSAATHLGEANVSANVIMAKTGHKSLRSVQRYVKPGLAAIHAATETLSSPRRGG